MTNALLNPSVCWSVYDAPSPFELDASPIDTEHEWWVNKYRACLTCDIAAIVCTQAHHWLERVVTRSLAVVLAPQLL